MGLKIYIALTIAKTKLWKDIGGIYKKTVMFPHFCDCIDIQLNWLKTYDKCTE